MRIILLLSLFVSPAFAFEITAVQARDEKGVFRIHTVVQCLVGEEESCLKICGDSQTCSRPEPVCVNCGGTANEMVRILFTRLESYYEPSPSCWAQTALVDYLASQKYVLLSHESVYNFHRAWGSQETLSLFQGFCQTPTAKPLLLLQLDAIGQPQELKAVICQDSTGNSYAQAVTPKAGAKFDSLKMSLK